MRKNGGPIPPFHEPEASGQDTSYAAAFNADEDEQSPYDQPQMRMYQNDAARPSGTFYSGDREVRFVETASVPTNL